VIRGPRLDIVVLPGAFLDAYLTGDLSLAHRRVDFDFPDGFGAGDEWIGIRRSQVLADPAWEPWSLRAMVLRNERRMVGYTSFHGPPGVNSLDATDAVEVGYTVFPEFRGLGYGTETGRAMLDWARREHGIRYFVSSIEPDNAASIAVIRKLGFVPLDLVLDGEAIFELHIP
jgi:ribosomal-protein-alanine N-acetyltransferase